MSLCSCCCFLLLIFQKFLTVSIQFLHIRKVLNYQTEATEKKEPACNNCYKLYNLKIPQRRNSFS